MSSPNADRGWTTRAPAKVNLDLRLLGVRDDGYHLVRTVLQSIDLADTLTLRPYAGPFALTCDSPGVPTDASNLAWRGAAAMASVLGVSLEGWALHLEKGVPAEAGLGGGSADAVAAARLVACAAGVEPSVGTLSTAVRGLGADVAFFAWGGTMLGEGVGDELTEMADVPPAAVVIVRPPFGVSTREAYGWYDADDAGSDECGQGAIGGRGALPSPGVVRDAGPANIPRLRHAWRNDLEGPVARRHPEIATIVRRLRDAGAWHAAMSGSGSACFGVFDPEADPSAAVAGWPDGTRVWRTHLLPRAEYRKATRCWQSE